MTKLLLCLGGCGTAALLAGCASITADTPSTEATFPSAPPPILYVAPFSTPDEVFRVDRTGRELEDFKTETALRLQTQLIKRLPEIAPTQAAPAVLPKIGWLITGKFVRVNQGSRALRGAAGLGLGATKMETEVAVIDLSREDRLPFLRFTTTGGSNAEPGMISGIGPVSTLLLFNLGAGGAGNMAHGISEDSWRTAREIRNMLVEQCRDYHVIR